MEKEFLGTKGSWKDWGGDNASVDIVLENNTTITISRYDRFGDGLVGTRKEMEANAQLVSAAPELLQACMLVLDRLNITTDAREMEKRILTNAINSALNIK